jgi:hypothetical protein
MKSGLCWLCLKGDRQGKRQGRTRGSHSKCEGSIHLGADFGGKSRLHAYAATANIVDLRLLLLAGLAAAVLRCSVLEAAFVSDIYIRVGKSHV